MGKTPFFVSTAIPYVNAAPHIGHALEFVQADVIARYQRLRERDVFFLSGSDDNATKNIQSAEQAGIPVAELVEKNSELFKKLLAELNVSNDDFIGTTEPRHVKGAQALWSTTNPDDLYKKTYRGLYCVGCEQFYTPDELNKAGECLEHPGRRLEEVEEENYFFRLSRYAEWLKGVIADGSLAIVPDTRRNEVLAFIEGGLKDFSVSRSAERTKGWGVSVPNDPSQVIYVWYDALANYITALGYPDAASPNFHKFWAGEGERVHVIGKGISRFHAIYWPAMLKSAGLPLPTKEFIHGYVGVNGQKISKTLGNIVDPFDIIREYGTDALRYWLTREMSTFEDGDFTWERFKEAYNANLANGLGNLTARVMKLAEDNLSGSIPIPSPAAFPEAYENELHSFEIKRAMDVVWDRIQALDKRINDEEPFKLVKVDKEKGKALIAELVSELGYIAALLAPFLPVTSGKIIEAIKANKKPETLFPRI